MISREEAIVRILANNERIHAMVDSVNKLRAETEQKCQQTLSEVSQVVGRNDQMRELFDISVEELQKMADGNEKPEETRQQRRFRERKEKP